MKLSSIMIILQAALMLASLGATGFMMYNIKGETTAKTGDNVFKSVSFIFYVLMGLHGSSLAVHGLSTFWCKGK